VFIVAASALVVKQQLFIPPLAEAWCGATDVKIAKMMANAMQRPFRYLPETRGAIMMFAPVILTEL
jgi:hypothetical protein